MSVNPPAGGSPLRDLGPGITRKVLLRRGVGGVVAASSLSALLAACGEDGATGTGAATVEPPATPTGTLRVALASQPRIFDPTLTFSVAELALTGSVYEGLATFNDDYSELVPALATSWEVSDDAREWRFTLREGVTFHDGAELDASAVRRSIEYVTREGSLYGFLAGAPEVDDSDPTVVAFKYRDPFADLARNWSLLTVLSPKLLAGSLEAAAKRVAASPAGTGPFRFAGARSGRDLALTASPDYWGEGLPHLQQLQLVILPDESARNAALQAGDVDLVMQVPPNAAGTLTSSGKARLTATPTWSGSYLDVACNLKPFDDPRVRQAIAYAVDRQSIVDTVLRGKAELMEGVIPAGVYGSQPAATQYAYDPDRARSLLADAGQTAPIDAVIATSADAVLGQTIIQALAAQLDEVGFKVTPRVLDNAAISKDQFDPNRKNAIVYAEMGWVNGGPLHISLGSFTTTPHYSSKAYDALVAKVNSTADGPAREQVLGEAVDLLAGDVPMIPLWAPERLDATATTVHGYQPPANVFPRFSGAYLAT